MGCKFPGEGMTGPVLAISLILVAALSTGTILGEDLWLDKNPYSGELKLQQGSILKLQVDEPVRIEYEYENQDDKNGTIKMVPDKKVTDFLPPVSSESSLQKSEKKKIRSVHRLTFRMAVTVNAKEGNVLTFQGSKRIFQEDGDSRLNIRLEGRVRAEDVAPDGTIHSDQVADLAILIQGKPVPKKENIEMKRIPSDQPGEPARPSAEMNDEEKQKMLLDYLNGVLGEGKAP